MKRTVFTVLQFAFFLVIGLILLYYAFRGVTFEELVNSLAIADFKWVAFALCFALIGYISRAYRWKLLIKPLNHDPSLQNVFYALMIGYTANFAFPRIGEITRCGTLRRSDNIPVDSLLGTVIIERAIDLVVLLFILFLVFFSKIGFFGAFFSKNIFNPFIDQLNATLKMGFVNWIIAVVAVIVLVILIRFINIRFSRSPVIKKIKELIRGVVMGLKTISKMEDRWTFVFLTLIIWLMYFLMTYVLVFAFTATAHLGPLDGLFLLVIGGMGMSAPVQGGIGAFHWIVSLGFFFYGFSKADAVAYATLSHESQSIFAILLGAFSFIMLLVQKSKAKIAHKS